jgi:uracil phosphoribosyltransferase
VVIKGYSPEFSFCLYVCRMVVNLSDQYTLLCDWIGEIRDEETQKDRMRFRRNLERIGEVAAYEISKTLPFIETEVQTPLGTAVSKTLRDQPVICAILRAGLPLHQGLHNFFDRADNGFISAYRKHQRDGSFEISLQYVSCPELEGRVVIIADAMLATGASLVKTIQYLREEGRPAEIHVVAAIACTVGIEFVLRSEPNCKVWCGAIDDELTAKGYIVPGLGDAGDLAYGNKAQM